MRPEPAAMTPPKSIRLLGAGARRRSAGILLAALLGVSCGGGSGTTPGETAGSSGSVLIYSGRSEALVGPLLERFQAASGVEVRARYGETAEMAATLLEEGSGSPADLFLSQDAAALGALSGAGRFVVLPESVLARVPARFRSSRGDWVGLSGRVRTVVYNTERVTPEQLPQSLEEVAAPRYRGAFGVAPANGSFQAHMTVYAVVQGETALARLLAGMAANEPGRYPKNSAIVEAVIAGEVDWGLVNHYYLWRALQESPGAPAANFVMPQGAAASFINLAGAGAITDRPEVRLLVEFLLSDEAQRYFSEETFEYPLVAGVAAAAGLQPLDQVRTPEVDFAAVSAGLPRALALIHESGLLE